MEEMKILEHATFWLEGDAILHCKFSNLDVHHRLDDKTAGLFLEAIEKLSKGGPVSLLVDLRDAKGTFSVSAAQFLSKGINNIPFIICEAYVVNSLSIKLLVQAYKRIYENRIPYGIFKNMSTAIQYSLSHIN